MLLLPDPLLSQSDLLLHFLDLVSVLIRLTTTLVLVALTQLFELSLLLSCQLCQTVSGLVELDAQVINQTDLFVLEVRRVLLKLV